MTQHKCDKLPDWYMVYSNDYPADYGWTVVCGYNSNGFVEPIYYCPFCGKNLMEVVTVINPVTETTEDDENHGKTESS